MNNHHLTNRCSELTTPLVADACLLLRAQNESVE